MMPSRTGGAPRIGAWAAFALVASFATAAHADQFTLVDVTWTHAADNTMDSHYRVDPLPATPPDWTRPFDWTKGSVHVRLDVLSKPAGGAPTVFQACLEGVGSYACPGASPVYTSVTSASEPYQWTVQFGTPPFYTPKDNPMQWSKGVSKVALIVKDDMNQKPQGDARYVPTKLHVEIVVVSEGDTYHPPASASDAGLDGSAGASDASLADADTGAADTLDSSVAVRDAGSPVGREAGQAGGDAQVGVPSTDAGDSKTRTGGGDKGCAVADGGGSQCALVLLALGWKLRRRRRWARIVD